LQDFLLDGDAKISLMSEELTRELPDGRSFEERVFACFDAMDARFDAMEARFDAVDARFDAIDRRFDGVDARLDDLDARVQVLESKALDTKPIWERALAEILEVKKGVEDLNRKVDLQTLDVMQVRADQRRVNQRMDELESRAQ
jgi:chromosome segregation ATPase